MKMENKEQWCMAWVPAIPAASGKTKGAIMKDATWQPGETITASFLDGDPALQKRVREMAERWTSPGMANLSVDFLNHNTTDIRISFKYKGSWSLLGKYCRQRPDTTLPTMNYGWLTPDSEEDELRRVVLHEFGHALGFIHEQQNPINSIKWNRDAVIADLSGPPNNWSMEQIQINMFDQLSPGEVFGTPVDKSSIMMYPIPASWTEDGFSVGLNSDLSQKDRELAIQVYHN
jgi:serralysin